MGWAWVSHFDNTEWTVQTGSWVTDHWETSVEVLDLYPPIGSWDDGYRPTKIRVTHSGDGVGFGTANLVILDTEEATIGSDYTYVSLEEVDLSFGANDIYWVYVYLKNDGNVTDIEFYESQSSSSSSSLSKSSSSSSRSSSSSSKSSSSKSSSSSSRSSSSSSSAQHHEIDIYLDTETHKAHRISTILDSELWNPLRNEIQLDVEITASSMIWGYVKDWRGHIVRKQCIIIISSLDGTTIYGRTNSDKDTGYFNTKISVASGTNVLVSCFLEGIFRGQENLAGSLIFTTASSSSSSSSMSSSSESSSSSSSSLSP